jgi:hypothetical protein
MDVRKLLVAGGILFVAGAVWVECMVRYDVSTARPGAASAESHAGAVAGAAAERSPHRFALLEIAVETTPAPWVPYVFALEVRGADGVAAGRIAAPSENGVALFGPLDAGTVVRATVVVGGAAFGLPGDGEKVGEGELTIGARGGRQFLVVPVHWPPRVDFGTVMYVVDDEQWPLPGATVTSDSGVFVTDARGICDPGPASDIGTIDVVPPRDRPDLAPCRVTKAMRRQTSYVTLHIAHRADAAIDELAADCRAGRVEDVWLRAAGSRAWVRSWNVTQGGRLESVPLGRYHLSWAAGDACREGRLELTEEAAHFELSAPATPCASVAVTGIPDPARGEVFDALVLVERSERSTLVPATVRDSLGFEAMYGCGWSNWFAIAGHDEDGTPVFRHVPPGTYELRTHRSPRVLSSCLVVPPEPAGPVRVVADYEPQEGSIHGTLRGPRQPKSWIVEARVRGEYSASKRLHVGGTYELTRLPPGIYSVWASREDWGQQPLRGEPLPESPWRNVAIDGYGSVSLDFDVE